jgi:cation:H+ antiporter
VTLPTLSLQLIASTIIILWGANQLTRWADIIAEKTGLGRSFVGVLLLATATSLPELGTGVSSILLVESGADLAMGAAFGSNLFNLVIICLLDVVWRQGPILTAVSGTSVLVAGLGILIISISTLPYVLPQAMTAIEGFPVSPISLLLLAIFVWAMHALFADDRDATPRSTVEMRRRGGADAALITAFVRYASAALVVIAGSIWLAKTGEGIVKQTGLEASFVGTQFLALCTSLPEVATSLAALRIGAPDLALSNVLGSNLFNMGFVLFANDLAYVRGSIWSQISQIHAFTGGVAIVMTGVVVVGLLRRRRPTAERHKHVGRTELFLRLALYLGASFVVFRFG